MSFLDFIRVHRLPDEAGWRHPDGANLHHIPPQNPVPPPRVLRQEPPQPQPQPQPERDVQLPDQVHSDDSENYRPLENEHEDELESPNTTMLAQDLNNQHRIDNIPEEAELIDGAGVDADLNGGGGDGGAGGGFDNDFDGFENELPPGEGEIQFALDELLGLRGVTHLLRNAWLLLAFNCVYIGLFASFPYMVGVSICRFVGQSSWVKASYAALQWLVPQSIVLASQVTTLSSSSEDALQFSDVVLVVLGYASLFFMIFALSETLYTLREVFSPSFLTNSILSLAALANVVKVGLLLLVRVFILPVILGIVVLVCANTFLGYGTNDWAVFISSNVVGSISLSWVAGISYMVSTTLTVLQLREILHPNILARNIRPQEPHFQLLLSLMYESTFTHCRRVLTSMMVYLSLLFVFVYTPMYVARHVQDMFSTAVESPSVDSVTTKSSANFPLYFNYYVPQIQIPFELAFAHLTFLTLLDRHKDKIGRMLFLWFTKVGKFFGVDRMLLPFYMIPYPPSLMYHDSKNSKFYKHANGSWYAGTQDGPLVRGPIVRPPPRWDDQNGRGVGRWAWGTETMSQLEMNVAPLVTPTFWALRLTALAFVTWAVIGVLVLCCVFLPLGFGRVVLKLMGVPFLWVHDPFCYSIGATAFWVLLSLVVDSTINLKVITPFMQVIRKMDMSVALLVAKLLLCWFTAELGIGVTIRTCLSSVPLSEPIAWPTRTLILGTYLKGVIISNAFLGLVFYGYLEKLLTFLDRAPDMVADEGTATTRVVDNRDPAIQAVDNWAKTVRNLLQKHILISSQENVWEFDVVRLEQLWSLLVKPLFTSSVVQTVGCYILVYAARYGSSVWLPSGVDKSNIDMLLVKFIFTLYLC